MFQKGLGLATDLTRTPDHLDTLSNPPFLSIRATFGALEVGHENSNKTRVFREFHTRPVAAMSIPLARREKPEGDVLERKSAGQCGGGFGECIEEGPWELRCPFLLTWPVSVLECDATSF